MPNAYITFLFSNIFWLLDFFRETEGKDTWRDFCRENCTFFSWNPDTKQCNVSTETSKICKTPQGSECSQSLEEDLENFTTVRAKSCVEMNMIHDSDCKWEADVPIEKDNTYRCARLNMSENSCIFFKHRIIKYNLWSEIKSSKWVWICTGLCIIYIFLGVPFLYLYKASSNIFFQKAFST